MSFDLLISVDNKNNLYLENNLYTQRHKTYVFIYLTYFINNFFNKQQMLVKIFTKLINYLITYVCKNYWNWK